LLLGCWLLVVAGLLVVTGLLGYWVTGLLVAGLLVAGLLVVAGLLGYWVTGLLGYWVAGSWELGAKKIFLFYL
jgi:hypothetical protein